VGSYYFLGEIKKVSCGHFGALGCQFEFFVSI
jgi:hypothetical protein